jgi:ribosome maturation factor RimP
MRGDLSPLFCLIKVMITADKIKKLVEEKIEGSPNFIVDVSVKPGNKITVLMDSDKGIVVADCVAVSRHIENSLDREVEDFSLEVSSPGLDYPLKINRQYKKNIGRQVSAVTKEGNKIIGKLISVNDNDIVIETKSTERVEGKKGKQLIINNINLTFNQIKEAKVVLTF